MKCCRLIAWDMGHRLVNHEGKCRRLHGHRYTAEIHCSGELDGIGRVVDFGVVKELVGGWVDRTWDHKTLLHEDDPLRPAIIDDDPTQIATSGKLNPTAENIAEMLAEQARRILAPLGIVVDRVVVWETPNCNATGGL